jgi:predicted acyl esterase
MKTNSRLLADAEPELHKILNLGSQIPPLTGNPPRFAMSEIRCENVWVTMRDGVRLSTDIYLPPTLPAPTIAIRTPYGRAADANIGMFVSLARRGYVVISQDCRGTGGSEPDHWDYYVHEREDSYDFVEWVSRQSWFDGFLAGCGSSYSAQTQWCMSMHPRMSAIIPQVGGLGVASRTVRKHLFYTAYARSIGKGVSKVALHFTQMERAILEETLAGGAFDEPLHKPFSPALRSRYPELDSLPPTQAKRWLWEKYCAASGELRAQLIKEALGESAVTIMGIDALQSVFGHEVAHDAHMFPTARVDELCKSLHAPALMITGWYDWSLNDPLASWELLRRHTNEPVRSNSRFIITPAAHNMAGYHEGRETHPELDRNFGMVTIIDLLLRWYAAVRDQTVDTWPAVIYYLMGANEWHVASDWPVPEARKIPLYLGPDGVLTTTEQRGTAAVDKYKYDPADPTPTVGGSILSYVYPPGSVDVSSVQRRADVLCYTTAPLKRDVDVVGPLKLYLYASSSALDTDFSGRLSDVFPDGRAIQLQTGILRARYRDGDPAFLEPGRIYRFEIDMWATANRFKAGHRLRLDICSADFPRFDRNMNRGGDEGLPVVAEQTIYRDAEHPSHLVISVLGEGHIDG